jgi:hypothetical protein
MINLLTDAAFWLLISLAILGGILIYKQGYETGVHDAETRNHHRERQRRLRSMD